MLKLYNVNSIATFAGGNVTFSLCGEGITCVGRIDSSARQPGYNYVVDLELRDVCALGTNVVMFPRLVIELNFLYTFDVQERANMLRLDLTVPPQGYGGVFIFKKKEAR